MKAISNMQETQTPKKQIGQFKNMDEAVKFKTDIVNKMLAKVDRNSLINLGK